MFTKAQKNQSKLRLCVSGPSGSGKTLGALKIATSIKESGRIAVIDTENGSASLYADLFDFDVLNMAPPYEPERFVEAIKEAEKAGYAVIVIDSASHEWDGDGGCLEINEETARAKFKGNTWSAWSDTTKRHQKFISAITHSAAHIICTARSKTETAQGENKKVVRLGMKLVQRDNFEYEFTVALDLVHDGHFANALKDRTGLFASGTPKPITEETGAALLAWLKDGRSEDEIIESAIADIYAADDMEQLADIFKASVRMTHGFDESQVQRIVEAKDEMKMRLSEPQQEVAANG